jgi:Ca2+-binding EF-hand superfamily protein
MKNATNREPRAHPGHVVAPGAGLAAACAAPPAFEFYTHQTTPYERHIVKLMKSTLLALLALSAAALTAGAQDNNNNDGPPPGGGFGGGPGPRGPGGHRPPPLPLVLALDTNHDGVIDAAEIANASAALLTLDKNGDGVLTTNEYLPPLPKDAPPNAPRPPLPLIVKALDANGDGVIDAAEIANASAALKTLDKNGDGVLTPDEYIGRPPHRGGNHRPDGGFGGGNAGGNGMNDLPGDDRPAGPPPDDAPPGPPPADNQ